MKWINIEITNDELSGLIAVSFSKGSKQVGVTYCSSILRAKNAIDKFIKTGRVPKHSLSKKKEKPGKIKSIKKLPIVNFDYVYKRAKLPLTVLDTESCHCNGYPTTIFTLRDKRNKVFRIPKHLTHEILL